METSVTANQRRRVPPRAIQEPLHVIAGESAAGNLRAAGGQNLLVLRDALFAGPCDLDPDRHIARRREHWRNNFLHDTVPEGASEDYLADVAAIFPGAGDFAAQLTATGPTPVVLWTFPSWVDRVAFWWMLDAIRRAGLDVARFWVAEPACPGGSMPFGWIPPPHLGERSPASLMEAFAALRPLKRAVVQVGASLWRKYTSPSPLAFDRARRQGVTCFPELPAIAEVHGRYFPRVEGSDRLRLRLSLADQALLEALPLRSWRSPLDLLRGGLHRLEAILALGDYFLARRLVEWAAHGPQELAVLARRQSGSAGHLDCLAYRLTWRGRRLRREGLDALEEAPPLWLGGCLLYDTEHAWVRRGEGSGWRLERLRA